jgi:hypothetical protein
MAKTPDAPGIASVDGITVASGNHTAFNLGQIFPSLASSSTALPRLLTALLKCRHARKACNGDRHCGPMGRSLPPLRMPLPAVPSVRHVLKLGHTVYEVGAIENYKSGYQSLLQIGCTPFEKTQQNCLKQPHPPLAYSAAGPFVPNSILMTDRAPVEAIALSRR